MKHRPINKYLLFLILFICLLIGLGYGMYAEQVHRLFALFSRDSIYKLVELLRSFGWIAPVMSIGFMILQAVAAPLPGFVITAANGMVFGIFWGFVISWVGGMAGALLNFWLARKLGYGYTRKLMDKYSRLGRIDEISGRNGFAIILIARLVPIVSFDVISLLAGISNIRFRSFLIATGIGQIPGTLLYVILGHDLMNIAEYETRLWWLAVSMIVLIILSKWISKKRIKSTNEGSWESS
ncbi:TVP38/TMEM64 family protein [Marinicrinis sediminis]|uniref:TVP38/TMEM64 family membrane protein n=1 Tax=Marinicrinis sediminis TaxID=1652465 RepID=A0ABW5REP5_9BACL